MRSYLVDLVSTTISVSTAEQAEGEPICMPNPLLSTKAQLERWSVSVNVQRCRSSSLKFRSLERDVALTDNKLHSVSMKL